MNYIMTINNGKTFSGNPAQLVCQMKNSNVFTEREEKMPYMEGVAWRVENLLGLGKVRHDNAENFLTDLFKAGIISLSEN